MPLPGLFQIHGLFSHQLLLKTCMYFICIDIPKYNLLSLYNVNSLYVFKDDHLALDNQRVCSSLGRTNSVVFCIGLRPHGLFPANFGMFIGFVLVQLMLDQSCWCLVSDVPRRHSLTANSLTSLALTVFSPLLLQSCLCLRCESSL